MGFLRKLLGGSPDPDVEISAYKVVPDRTDAIVEIVGEQSYQDNIFAAGGGRDEDGPLQRNQIALLMLEPNNQYDRNAITVFNRGPPGRIPQPGGCDPLRTRLSLGCCTRSLDRLRGIPQGRLAPQPTRPRVGRGLPPPWLAGRDADGPDG